MWSTSHSSRLDSLSNLNLPSRAVWGPGSRLQGQTDKLFINLAPGPLCQGSSLVFFCVAFLNMQLCFFLTPVGGSCSLGWRGQSTCDCIAWGWGRGSHLESGPGWGDEMVSFGLRIHNRWFLQGFQELSPFPATYIRWFYQNLQGLIQP